MTIASQTRTAGPFIGTGLIVGYPFSFKVFQSSDLLITQTDTSGGITTPALGGGYTVVLNADQNTAPGGVVTPISALPTGYSWLITSAVSVTQGASLTNAGGFFPKTIEDALDRLTILIQQSIGGTLPSPAARLDKLFAFDATTGAPVATAFTATQVAAAVSAAGRTSFVIDYAIDVSAYDPLGRGVAIYGGVIDCAAAINAALAVNPRVQISGVALIKSQIVVPNGKSICFLPGGQLVLDTTAFTGAINTATAVGVLFNGNTRGGIFGNGVIRTSTYVDNQALVAVRVLSSSSVRIEGLECYGFSNADGIIRIDSSTDCFVVDPHIHDSSTAILQVSGIVIDGTRAGGGSPVNSARIDIVSPKIHDLTGPSNQSDGITVEGNGLTVGVNIVNPNIFNVGEGIDCWGAQGTIIGGTIRACTLFGLKFIHGASQNVAFGVNIFGSGLANLCFAGDSTLTIDTQQNMFVGGFLGGVDPSGTFAGSTTACVLIQDNGGGGGKCLPRLNIVRNTLMNPGPNGKYVWSRSASVDTTNRLVDCDITQKGSVGLVDAPNGGARAGNMSLSVPTSLKVYLSSAQNVAAASSARVILDTLDTTLDFWAEFDLVTNHRFTATRPGEAYGSAQFVMGTVAVAGTLCEIQIRKNGGVMCRLPFQAQTGCASPTITFNTHLEPGDYIEMWCVNGLPANVLSLNNGASNTFLVVRQA